MLPVSDFDCLESAGSFLSIRRTLSLAVTLTFTADNALILGDPWFRQFVIFHDLRHHEVTDKTNNVSCDVRLSVFIMLSQPCDCLRAFIISADALCMCCPAAT